MFNVDKYFCEGCRRLDAEVSRLEAELEALHCAIRTIPNEVANAVSRTVDEVVQSCLEASPGPTPVTRKAVMAGNAARAQCFRRALSDGERRKAVDRARVLGALAEDFDESRLPWSKHPADHQTAAPQSTTVALALVRPPRSVLTEPSFFALADDVPDRHHPRYPICIAVRLARLAGYEEQMRETAANLWRDAGQLGSTATADSTVRYPSGVRAIVGQNWNYPNGMHARLQGRLYLPMSLVPIIFIRQPSDLHVARDTIMRGAAEVLDKTQLDATAKEMDQIDEALVPLALLELAYATTVGCSSS